MITVNLEASNEADWIIQLTAIDDETQEDIDFTGADIAFIVKDSCRVTRLTATTTLGNITFPTDGTLIQIQFTPDEMGALCADRYTLGCVYSINDETTQLLNGYVDVYDGVASL